MQKVDSLFFELDIVTILGQLVSLSIFLESFSALSMSDAY